MSFMKTYYQNALQFARDLIISILVIADKIPDTTKD